MTADARARRVHIIGIGAGSPAFLTQQAVAALNDVDVFLVADKGEAKSELVALRRVICDAHIAPDHEYRLISVPDPNWGRDDMRIGDAYTDAVTDWHRERADRYAGVIASLPLNAVVGFLVWGDPAFYDSTIRIVDDLASRMALDVHVVPGISAFQALAAAHGIVLHAVGEPIHITTGRRLVGEWQPGTGTTVVMLDGVLACRGLVERAPDLRIHWAAYVGMPQQVLRVGRLADVIDELVTLRAQLRAEHGWIMDVYSLSE